jgi:cysteine desulfurase
MRHIYLDYVSTTPLAPAVQEAMIPFLAEFYGVPNGAHWLARASAEAIEDARSRLGTLLGVQRDEIIFTSGAIESINLALKGCVLRRRPFDTHVVIAAVDQPSVHTVANFLESWGCDISILPVSPLGILSPADLDAAIQPTTTLVSIPHVVADTGVIQPVRALAEVCHRRNVLLHVDASFSAGLVPVAAQEMGADMLSLSGHRMYAPKGSGALYLRHGLAIEPLIHGVGHESGMRAGMQHLAGIVGLGRAAQIVRDSLDIHAARISKLRDRLYAGLCATLSQALPLYGDASARVPGTLAVGFPECSAEELLARTPEICAQALTTSTTLQAMGATLAECRSTIRFGIGWYTTEEEIDHAISALAATWESLRG